MRDFFAQNETIIDFASGLVFFSLGFAVWLQRRRSSRLTLTSSLIWLASFAFVEALEIWGFVFVPIQRRAGLDAGVVNGLLVLRALLLAAAALMLLWFGLRLFSLERGARQGLLVVGVLVVAVAMGGSAALAARSSWSVAQWEASARAAVRYSVLFPAALLAGAGVWRQRQALAIAGMTRSRPYATTAAVALLVFAAVGGLMVESAAWAPGGPASDRWWTRTLGFPLAGVRGIVGLVLAFAVVRLLDIFEVEAKQRLESVDRARAVAEERARFGRDLHDGTIQSIYAAGLQLEAVALRAADGDVRAEVQAVIANLNQVIGGLRDYILALRQPASTPDAIAHDLGELAACFAEETGLRVRFRVAEAGAPGPLPAEAGQHLPHVLREALANAARHAGPCDVEVTLTFAPDEMDLAVVDSGRGIDPGAGAGDGQGLRNMRERARRLGGRLTVTARTDGGTAVTLAVPLDAERPAEADGVVPSLASDMIPS